MCPAVAIAVDVVVSQTPRYGAQYRTVSDVNDQFIVLSRSTTLYRVCQKMIQLVFCHSFVKSLPNLIIFGKQIAKTIKLCKVHLLSPSRSLCQRTTV